MATQVMRIIWFLIISAVISHEAWAQLWQRPQLRFGWSIGIGGVYFPLRLALDFHKGTWNFTLAPDFFYLSLGLRKRFTSLRYCANPYSRFPRFYIALAYQRTWKHSQRYFKETTLKRFQLFSLLIGIHQDLDWLQRTFIEGGIGIALAHLRYLEQEDKSRIYPMIELRFGYVFYRRSKRLQRLPIKTPIVEEERQKMLLEQLPTASQSKEYKRQMRQERKQRRRQMRQERKAQ